MKLSQKEKAVPPLLRNSLIYFEECCSRDILSQNGLLYRHKYTLYQNARNQRRFTHNSRRGSLSVNQMQHKSYNVQKTFIFKQYETNPNFQRPKQSGILNITPAVIHTPVSPQLRSTLSLTSKSDVRQNKKQKTFKWKANSNNWCSQSNSVAVKERGRSFFGIDRPKTANQNISGLNNITVELPCRPRSSKLKDQAIKGWQNSYQEDQL